MTEHSSPRNLGGDEEAQIARHSAMQRVIAQHLDAGWTVSLLNPLSRHSTGAAAETTAVPLLSADFAPFVPFQLQRGPAFESDCDSRAETQAQMGQMWFGLLKREIRKPSSVGRWERLRARNIEIDSFAVEPQPFVEWLEFAAAEIEPAGPEDLHAPRGVEKSS